MPTVDVPEKSEESALPQETEESAASADSWGLRLLFLFLFAFAVVLLVDLLKAIWRG